MDVSIVGAAGEVGRSITTHLLRGNLLTAADRLQLIGHGLEGTEQKLLAERCDLLDAFDETAPRIDVTGEPDGVAGEVIVVAAGVSTAHVGMWSRRDLAAANRAIFDSFGAAIGRDGTGREVVIIVTNPVELGVEILSRHLDRHRVLGMGAQQDALRFARAVAADAHVRRDQVEAWVYGEHGDAVVPLWSSGRILGTAPPSAHERVAQLAMARRGADFAVEVDHHKHQVFDLLAAERIRDAFATVEALPPDLRIVLEPFVTAHCLHSTPNATANATCDLIRALRSGRESVVAAQVRLDGEFHDLHTNFGTPVLINAEGWPQVVCPPVADDEVRRIERAAAIIEANLDQWTR
jgi:malate dehydrogenase